MATTQTLKTLEQKIQDFSDEQVRLLEQFADLLRAPKNKTAAGVVLKRLLDKRAQTRSLMSDQDAMRLALEAVAWARGKAV